MNTAKQSLLGLAVLATTFFACTTDPILPPGITTPPPVQDPGEENLCAEGVISFQHEVLPLLISSCAYSGCHDADSHKEGVVLETYEKVMREVKAGNPNDSELYESITHQGGDEAMPPPPADPLTSDQIALIRDWILQGAENTDCGTPCDSTQATFAADIYPLLSNFCVGCHNSNRADGGVELDSYSKVKNYADNGYLMAVIRHDPPLAPMPPTGSQLSDCRIAQIQKWIDDGALNN
ncbi:MAG: c-type cytochrome [Phaeodactylibacter sp.]|nr:c-type cytochrome [Phaeodactylibacter sp.]